MKKYILPIIIILVLLWLAFDKVSNIGLTEEFKVKQDSLVATVDSMKLDIIKDNAIIDSLEYVDQALTVKLDIAKKNVKVITKYVDSSKSAIDNYNEQELISSFNTRYPEDTVTNPLPVAQPVLVAAAKDLVELDGAKQIITIKDSVIALTEARVTGKDSIIAVFIKKEGTYKKIMFNQDTQIKDWKFQFNALQLQNTKLKAKNKFTKIGAGLVVGGLVYLMIAK
jgi:hypothetical protein